MFSVVLDTCVLYPSYLRDTLLRIASARLYRALWSEEILDELRRNLPARIGDDRADRLLGRMRQTFPDAIVTGHEPLIDAMTNDPKDRHVLAAAVRADAAAIVTFNLNDFPPEALEPYAVEALHPDDFLLNQLDLAPGQTIAVLRQQIDGYARPSMTLTDLAAALSRSGCPAFADQICLHIDPTIGPS